MPSRVAAHIDDFGWYVVLLPGRSHRDEVTARVRWTGDARTG
jgi:hypothetical protein